MAPLHRLDQEQLLAALPVPDATVVRTLLDALRTSNLPVDALPAGWLEAETPSTAMPSQRQSPIDWSAMAVQNSPVWVARALACMEGAEREFCLAMLDPAVRDAVSTQLAQVPTLPIALQGAVRHQLLNVAEAG
ncbi:hypothetical protein DCO49_00275 [Stenotrophomonas sp. SPM]|nr:hypothetical protein DCO49_00275 [Stenotrophomonas sp. SPM]